MTAWAFPKPAKREKAARKPLRRTRIKRRFQTKQQAREAVFAPYERWLKADGAICIVCGTPENIQGAHVGLGGMGLRNGTAADKIRMCGPRLGEIGCHARFDQTARPWTKKNKAVFSVQQRIAHWSAFRAWAGIEIRIANLELEPANEIQALIACDEAIGECLARLGGTT